jgi:succinate dehydrogenase/fumarate reductase-like Fe-S protein
VLVAQTNREDAGAVAAAEATTILAALDEAADNKRDRAANCADCADQSCGSCQFRLTTARAYDRAAARLLAGQEASQPAEPTQQPPPAHLPVGIQPQPLAEMEAGQ